MSKAATVSDYLKELPAERRQIISAVRKEILRKLPKGYKEVMNWGMITYEVPLKRYPDTYNGQPLCYAGLAAQKNNYVVHLMPVGHPKQVAKLKAAFKKAGKKLDMGKCCVRFRKLEDIPLQAIGEVVASHTPEQWIAFAKASWKR